VAAGTPMIVMALISVATKESMATYQGTRPRARKKSPVVLLAPRPDHQPTANIKAVVPARTAKSAHVNVVPPGNQVSMMGRRDLTRNRPPWQVRQPLEHLMRQIPYNKDRGTQVIAVIDRRHRIVHNGTLMISTESAAAMASEKRLAWTILWLHGKVGRRIPMTRRMIAETAGVARETSIRMLSPLEKKGWLKTRRGVVELLKPERFRELLEAR
jgi:hypothetical protein